MQKCDRCEKNEVRIRFGSEQVYEHLCFDCYNKQMEDELEVKLDSPIEGFSVKDGNGNSRFFSITKRLDPLGIFLEAEETVAYGYQYAVQGELYCDQKELFNRLIEKVKEGVKRSNLKVTHFPNGQQTENIVNEQVVGRVDYDESNVTPIIVIDGKPYTWDQLGQMVGSFEGFQILMKFFDMTDDVE